MRIIIANWWWSMIAIVVCSLVSAKIAHSVTEKRMDALLKHHQKSMEREARIWLDWVQAFETGNPAELSWLHTTGGLVLSTYRRQAENEPWAQNPALQEQIRKHRANFKPGRKREIMKKLREEPWLPEAAREDDK